MKYYHKSAFNKALVITCMLLSWSPIRAQNALYTLKNALDATSKNYPSIKAKDDYIKVAEQQIKEARREYIPSLKMIEEVSYATANSLPGTYFSFGTSVSGGITDQQQNNPNFGAISALSAEWPVFTFGAQKAKVGIAQAADKLAQINLENEKFQMSVKTAQAYFDLIALIRLRETAEVNLQRAKSIRNIINTSTMNGLKPGVDSSIANAEVSRAKINLIEAQNNENMQRNYLIELTGETNLNNMLPDTAFLQKLPSETLNPESVNQNPLISYYKEKEALSYANEIFVRRSYLPKISILGETWGRGSGISTAPGNAVNPSFSDGTSLTRFNYAIGLGAVFNITDYPRISAQANAIKYETMGLHEETNEQILMLQTQLNNADVNYISAYNKAKESPILVAAATTAYNQMLAMYNSGLTNLTDLAQALYNLNDAETQNTISYDNVWKALLFKTIPTGNINVLMNQL